MRQTARRRSPLARAARSTALARAPPPCAQGNASGKVGCGFWNNNCGGLNLVIVWEVAYGINIGLICIVFPFMIFFYEADDEGLAAEDAARLANSSTFMARLCDWRGCGRNALSALIYTAITLVIVIVVIALMYTFLGVTDIPYQLTMVAVTSAFAWQPYSTTAVLPSCSAAAQLAGQCLLPCGSSCSFVGLTMSVQVSLIIYITALISFVGWFIFSIYVGIGFVALPINCINAFKFRPRPLAASELLKQRKALRDRASELLKMCQDLGSKFVAFNDEVHSKRERRKAGKVNSTDMNRFRVLVDLLEADLEKFQMSDPQYYRKYFNPFVPYFKLVFGVISIILTVCWIIQIILFMLLKPPVYGFLNNYFFWFDTWFPLFGTISVAIFALYLLLCVAVGNAKFGTRFFLIKVHPLEAGKTLLNGMIFNISLILLCVLPVTQFCTSAFATYAQFTDASNIFGTQFMYLRFFRYFWAYNVFLLCVRAGG